MNSTGSFTWWCACGMACLGGLIGGPIGAVVGFVLGAVIGAVVESPHSGGGSDYSDGNSSSNRSDDRPVVDLEEKESAWVRFKNAFKRTPKVPEVKQEEAQKIEPVVAERPLRTQKKSQDDVPVAPLFVPPVPAVASAPVDSKSEDKRIEPAVPIQVIAATPPPQPGSVQASGASFDSELESVKSVARSASFGGRTTSFHSKESIAKIEAALLDKDWGLVKVKSGHVTIHSRHATFEKTITDGAESRKSSFEIHPSKITTNDSDSATFVAMLIAYQKANEGKKAPMISTTEADKPKWMEAVEQVYKGVKEEDRPKFGSPKAPKIVAEAAGPAVDEHAAPTMRS